MKRNAEQTVPSSPSSASPKDESCARTHTRHCSTECVQEQGAVHIMCAFPFAKAGPWGSWMTRATMKPGVLAGVLMGTIPRFHFLAALPGQSFWIVAQCLAPATETLTSVRGSHGTIMKNMIYLGMGPNSRSSGPDFLVSLIINHHSLSTLTPFCLGLIQVLNVGSSRLNWVHPTVDLYPHKLIP